MRRKLKKGDVIYWVTENYGVFKLRKATVTERTEKDVTFALDGGRKLRHPTRHSDSSPKHATPEEAMTDYGDRLKQRISDAEFTLDRMQTEFQKFTKWKDSQ